jgi:hypothetical protein
MPRSPRHGARVNRTGGRGDRPDRRAAKADSRCPNAGRCHHRVPSLDKPGTAGPLSVLPVVQRLRPGGGRAARCPPGNRPGGMAAAALPPLPPRRI